CSHMRWFIAGATASGASVARQTVLTRSSAKPCASLAMVLAVAGATTTRSAQRASSRWPIAASAVASHSELRTVRCDTAWKLCGSTKRCAASVIATWTSAPASRRRRTSSTALYAAIPPHTHSSTRFARAWLASWTVAFIGRWIPTPSNGLAYPMAGKRPTARRRAARGCYRHADQGLARQRTPPREDDRPRAGGVVRRGAAGDRPRLRNPRPGRGDHRAPPAVRARSAARAARTHPGGTGRAARPRPGPRLPAAGRAGTVRPLPRRRTGTWRGADRPGRRGPLLRPALARPPQRSVRGAVPRHPPPRAGVRGAVPRHRGRRRGPPARGRPPRARAQRRRGDRRPQPPERQRRTQRRRPRGHRATEASAGAGRHPPAGPFRGGRRRSGVAGRAWVGVR